MRAVRWGVVGIGLLLAGCAASKIPDNVQTALDKADAIVLLSLEPNKPPAPDKDAKATTEEKKVEEFHGWPVLGKTTVKDADTRKNLVAALRKGVAANDGMVAGCFIPRHGLQVTYGGKTYDLVICFQCLSAQTYEDGTRGENFLTTASPQAVFDKVLSDAGVKLADKAK